MSMAEELMTLVTEEEYAESVTGLTDDEYITKTEVTSIRKMISGKLWVDSRKFMNRKNQCIPTGMYELFGSSMSKSASTIHAEVCEYFLDPDRKELRAMLRDSMKTIKRSYSSWINNLNNINTPCDEFVLYLLCRCYKRHVCLVTAKCLICSFKMASMTTFQKLRKCDSVLLWLGESKFAEMVPLQNRKGAGPLQEWTLASECINHLHEKNIASKRPRKPMLTTSTDIAPATSPRGTKRKRAEIDYKQYHNDGILSSRSPESSKKQKILPSASGPSESRIASQEYITHERKNTTKPSTILGSEVTIATVKKELIPSNRVTRISHKLVKEEPGIRMVHRKEQLMGPEKVIHPCGRLCKSSNKGGYYDDELPDLPTVSLPASRSGQTISSPPSSRVGLTLHSPLSVRRSSTRQRTCTATSTQVGTISDILSGYVSMQGSRAVATATHSHSRVVQTPQPPEPYKRYHQFCRVTSFGQQILTQLYHQTPK